MNAIVLTVLLVGAAGLSGCVGDAETKDTGSKNAHATGGDSAFRDQILAAYTAKPIKTTADVSPTNTPAHVWLALDDETVQFVHWDADDVTKAGKALFVGDGRKGKFCLGEGGITSDEYDAGFVHFHLAEAPNWDAGHNNGGDYADHATGWWLRHVGAQDASMKMMDMDMTIRKGEVFLLMPADKAKLEACGGHGMPSGGGSTTQAQLISTFTFQPFETTADVSEHNTPMHVWRQIDSERMDFLHFNAGDPAEATGLLFVGDGFKGKLCLGEAGVTQGELDAGYVHFHTGVAPNWDAGHNNGGDYDPSVDGWWLRHIGAMDGTMEMMGMEMTVETGKVFPLMPADVGSLEPCA